MAFADGEVDAATARRIAAAAAADAAIRQRVQLFRATTGWMRAAFPAQPATHLNGETAAAANF
jgi:anti-sigma factor RsiW